MRRAIATLMARSKREIPHYYLATDIDLAAALRVARATNEQRPVAERLLPAALLLKADGARGAGGAGAQRLLDRRRVRACVRRVHLGVAVSLRRGGLVAPAIHDADAMDLDTLMAALRDLVASAPRPAGCAARRCPTRRSP